MQGEPVQRVVILHQAGSTPSERPLYDPPEGPKPELPCRRFGSLKDMSIPAMPRLAPKPLALAEHAHKRQQSLRPPYKKALMIRAFFYGIAKTMLVMSVQIIIQLKAGEVCHAFNGSALRVTPE